MDTHARFVTHAAAPGKYRYATHTYNVCRFFSACSPVSHPQLLRALLAESLRDYFGKFGEITEVMVMKDPATRRSR